MIFWVGGENKNLLKVLSLELGIKTSTRKQQQQQQPQQMFTQNILRQFSQKAFQIIFTNGSKKWWLEVRPNFRSEEKGKKVNENRGKVC